MATKKTGSLLLNPNYTEDTVGFALESFLSLLSFPRRKFSIEPFSRGNERWLGADARLEGRVKSFKPFYMQFKRPFAYPDHSKAKIIKDRLNLTLDASPHALFFDLHPKKPHHADFQHNVLFRLRRRLVKFGIGDAAYVCPLFLDRSAYRSNLHLAGLKMWPRFWRAHPWEMKELQIQTGLIGGGAINFSAIPVLREHITIPPHAAVTDASHSYSFTELGEQVCFHSPLSLPESQSSLSAFLERVVGNIGPEGRSISADGASAALNALLSPQMDEQPLGVSFQVGDGDGISRWREFGRVLRTDFGIEQYAFVNWND